MSLVQHVMDEADRIHFLIVCRYRKHNQSYQAPCDDEGIPTRSCSAIYSRTNEDRAYCV